MTREKKFDKEKLMALTELRRKMISHPFEDFFRNELKTLHLEKLKFIESLVYEERPNVPEIF